MTGTSTLAPPSPLEIHPWHLFLIVPLFPLYHQTKIHVIQTKIHHFKVLCKQHTFSHLTVNFQHICTVHAVNNHSTKPFTKADKRAAIELWWANVPLKAIRSQLKMSAQTWRTGRGRLWSSGSPGCLTTATCRTWWSPCPGGCRRWLRESGTPPSIDTFPKISEIKILLEFILFPLF